MKKILILFICLVSCKTTSSSIDLKLEPSNESNVIAWYSNQKKEIWAISFPFSFKIKNKTNKEETFIGHKYSYNDSRKRGYVFLHSIEKDGKLKRLNSDRKIKIKGKELKEYIMLSKHKILNMGFGEKIALSYNDVAFENDSISLGSFGNFKKRLPNVTEELLKGDTLYVKMRNLDTTKKNYTNRTKLPVKW